MKITATTLARDVLKWLEPESKVKLRPIKSHPYCYPVGRSSEKDLQKILKAGTPCQVCALGALLCAKAYRTDKVKLSIDGRRNLPGLGLNARKIVVNHLWDELSGSAMSIELAFEFGSGVPSSIATAKQRLRWICKNIIANGRFVPGWLET